VTTLSAWDGLALKVHCWGQDDGRLPLLCLPGLVRTGLDFEDLAARHPGRRVVAPDYAGRGDSGRARDVARYAPEACLRDVMDACAALHLHRAIVVGTSMGGLLAMGLAAARPGLVAGVVLNDIGPEIGAAGVEMVRGFVGHDPAAADEAAAASLLRARLPDLSLKTEAEWLRMARLTYAPGADGRWHPRWDIRIAQLLGRPAPPLWPLFGALEGVPVLLVHGRRSTILVEATVSRMRAARPDMGYVALPEVGHAPHLGEPEVAGVLDGFLGS
jgi:pimeloyl-ACP methyl ester carboxylesterase